MTTNDVLKQLRFGPYLTPVMATGVVVECEIRGLVQIVGLSDAPIPWPMGERDGERQLVVFKSLARALRQDAPQAVAAAWGVDLPVVDGWKAACRQPRRRKKQTLSSPPIAWKQMEDDLLLHATLTEAARLTGRTLTAVRKRRRMLGLPDGRRAPQKERMKHDLGDRAETVCHSLRRWTQELTFSLATLRATYHQSKVLLSYWKSRDLATSRALSLKRAAESR